MNRLKLNQDETEQLLISSRYCQSLSLTHLQVGEEKICPSDSVQNLGVHFDQHARMHVHVKKVCQASFYHLRNISKIRRYLSQDTTEILIHAYITSKLDNCNSLLYGLPTYMINKLQIPYLPLYNAHFFHAEKAPKIEMRIIHGILCFRFASLISM